MNADPTTTDAPIPGDEPPSPAELVEIAGLSGMASETETFQHYQVLRREDGSLWELGRGAMGVTYKAFDTNLRCHVALKVISAQHLHSEVAGQRFIREARVAAQLRHRNIASVYHLGVDPNGFFYSMEFIDGETLEDLVARVGPLPVAVVLRIALQTARALAAAARQGLIHRDIKPANLMVLQKDEDGEDEMLVKVIDFGLARSYDPGNSNAQLTATGFVGTPLYASPEQLEEHDLDVRSDIYSLGVTLWILLTGRPPFEGKMTQVITQHLNSEPPWWQLGDCPEPARILLERMLRKDPAERFQSAVDLRVAIEACLRGLTGKDETSTDGSDAAGSDVPSVVPQMQAAPVTGHTGHYIYPAKPYPAGTPADRERLDLRAHAGETLAAPPDFGTCSQDKPTARRPLSKQNILLSGAAVIFVCALGYAVWRGSSNGGAAGTRLMMPVPTGNVTPSPSPKSRVGAGDVALAPALTPGSQNRGTAEPAFVETPPPALSSPGATLNATAAAAVASPSSRDNVIANSDDDLTASAVPRPTPEAQPSPTESPVSAEAAPTDSPASAQTAAGDDDENMENATEAKPAKSGSKATQRTRTRRSARRSSKPAPNFFQKLFGIKPKPKSKSR